MDGWELLLRTGAKMGMRHYKVIYVSVVTIVSLASFATLLLSPDSQFIYSMITQTLFTVLTYPLGFIASAVSFGAIFMGFAIPDEAMAFGAPVYAILGYIQWFKLFPALYRQGR